MRILSLHRIDDVDLNFSNQSSRSSHEPNLYSKFPNTPQITGPRRLRLPTIPGANLLLQLQPNQVVENLRDQNRLPTQTARLK